MKRLLITLILLASILLPFEVGWGYGIVNNSGDTPADSLSIIFYAVDSGGYKIVPMASGDSVFLRINYPSGALAFEDSAAYDGTKITATTRHGRTSYTWRDAVANLDGTPVQGVYTYFLFVKDLTGADLDNPFKGEFQLLTETDFHTSIEYIKDALDSLQNQDDWGATQTSAADAATKSGNCLDSLQAQDDWGAKEAGNVLAILDSIKLYDARLDSLLAAASNASFLAKIWNIAFTTGFTAGSVGDSLTTASYVQGSESSAAQEALDSIKLYDSRFDSLLAASSDASFLAKIWNIAFTTGFTAGSVGDSITTAGYVQGAGEANITDADMSAMADSVWLKLINAYTATAGCFGDVFYDSLDALVSSAGGEANITDADMGAMADSVWDKIYADMINVAGGAGDSLMTRLKNILDSLKLYDTRFDSLLAAASNASFLAKIWNIAFTTGFTAGSVGDSLTTESYVQGSESSAAQEALDSLQAQDDWLIAKMDSILLITGNDAGAFMHTATAATRDTAYYGIGNDTLFYEVFWHLTGVAGDDPDSTRVYAH